MRPSWDEYFMNLAIEASKKSTCPRAMVGAFIVKNNRPIATGYNGAPRGQPHCSDVGCLMRHGHCIHTIHAEENAIIFAGVDRTDGATLYSTHGPCYHCSGLMINAGIGRVVYTHSYGAGAELLEQAGIIVVKMEVKCQ